MKIQIDLFIINCDLTIERVGSKTFKTERGATLYLINNGYKHITGKEYAQPQSENAEFQRIAEVTLIF